MDPTEPDPGLLSSQQSDNMSRRRFQNPNSATCAEPLPDNKTNGFFFLFTVESWLNPNPNRSEGRVGSRGAGLEQRETSNVAGTVLGRNRDQRTQSTLVTTVSHFPSERLDSLGPGQTDEGTRKICAYPLLQIIELTILKLKFVKSKILPSPLCSSCRELSR